MPIRKARFATLADLQDLSDAILKRSNIASYFVVSSKIKEEFIVYSDTRVSVSYNDRSYDQDFKAFKKIYLLVMNFTNNSKLDEEIKERVNVFITSYEKWGKLVHNLTPIIAKSFDAARTVSPEYPPKPKYMQVEEYKQLAKKYRRASYVLRTLLIDASNLLIEGEFNSGYQKIEEALELLKEHKNLYNIQCARVFSELEGQLFLAGLD